VVPRRVPHAGGGDPVSGVAPGIEGVPPDPGSGEVHPGPAKTARVPKVLGSAADHRKPLDPYTRRCLQAILEMNLEAVALVSGLKPPKTRITREERRRISRFFLAAMRISQLRDARS
jgi:hypothetical protein